MQGKGSLHCLHYTVCNERTVLHCCPSITLQDYIVLQGYWQGKGVITLLSLRLHCRLCNEMTALHCCLPLTWQSNRVKRHVIVQLRCDTTHFSLVIRPVHLLFLCKFLHQVRIFCYPHPSTCNSCCRGMVPPSMLYPI